MKYWRFWLQIIKCSGVLEAMNILSWTVSGLFEMNSWPHLEHICSRVQHQLCKFSEKKRKCKARKHCHCCLKLASIAECSQNTYLTMPNILGVICNIYDQLDLQTTSMLTKYYWVFRNDEFTRSRNTSNFSKYPATSINSYFYKMTLIL